jgi:hypothetical protein
MSSKKYKALKSRIDNMWKINAPEEDPMDFVLNGYGTSLQAVKGHEGCYAPCGGFSEENMACDCAFCKELREVTMEEIDARYAKEIQAKGGSL